MANTTRKTYRSHIGRALGRNYWDLSTVAANCTTDKLFDTKRTEYPAFWDGASLKIGTEEVYVRGGGGSINTGTGIIYLDRALSGAPAAATEYEILKGWTFADVDEGIDFAFGECYPEFFLPVIDTTVAVEVANQIVYPLTSTWKKIISVEREQIAGQTPAWYQMLYEGRDYTLGVNGSGQITIEIVFTPEAGRKMRVRAQAAASVAAGDASQATYDIPWQVITPGALAYLFDKGLSADEMGQGLRQKFDEEAARESALFEKRKVQYRPKQQVRRAAFPIISERNDGLSVQH